MSNSMDKDTVFPACAGMNRNDIGNIDRLLGVPRMRGDEPELRELSEERRQCSPHARG